MAPPKNKPNASDDDWMSEGVEGADDWMAEGIEGAPVADTPNQQPAQRTFYVQGFDGNLQPASYDEAFRANAAGLKVFSEAEARALGDSTQVTPPVPMRPATTPQIGGVETFLNRAVNAVPLGHPVTDVLSASAVQAAKALGLGEPGAKLTPQAELALEAEDPSFRQSNRNSLPNALDAYRQLRDIRNARTALGSEQNSWAGRGGTALGLGLSMLAPLPKVVPKGTGLGDKMAAGALTGAGYGALTGLTEGPADLTRGDVAGAARDTLLGAGLGAAVGGTLPAAVGGGWKTRAGAGALLGGGYGALSGAGDPKATSGERAFDTVLGAVAGAGGATGLPLAARMASAAYRGIVQPTEAAQYLRSKGVPLTVGQMNPNSKLAQLEEVGTSYGAIGPEIEAQRRAASQGWQNAVLDEARPPGMPKLNPQQPIDERLAAAYKGFDEAYAPARGVMVEPRTSAGVPLLPQPAKPLPAAPAAPGVPAAAPSAPKSNFPRARGPDGRFLKGPAPAPTPETAPAPAVAPADVGATRAGRPSAMPQSPTSTPAAPPASPPQPTPGAFDRIVDDPSVLATADERGVVRKFLENELTLISKGADKGNVPSDVILKMRSNIRNKLAQEMKAQNFPKAQLLENAERELTDVLETSLPPENMAALRAADAQYARYKPVESAVARAGDQPGGFTPAQLSASIRSDMEKGAYARGGGGEMRQLASAGREVLDARVPKTGMRTLATMPGLRWPMAAMSYSANLPGPQRFLLGETAPQRAFTTVEDALASVLRRTPTEAGVRAALPDNVEAARTKALADYLLRRNPQDTGN